MRVCVCVFIWAAKPLILLSAFSARNGFYYDTALQRWRQHGAPDQDVSQLDFSTGRPKQEAGKRGAIAVMAFVGRQAFSLDLTVSQAYVPQMESW